MENSLVPIDPALVALVHGSFGKNGELLPFAQEIMLIECAVAGTSHRPVQEIESSLQAGTFLMLKREAQNPHDALAIMILTEGGEHIGYVPRVKNEALARLMDAGKLLFARIESKKWRGDWLKIDIQIFLRDLS
ncbi:MAG: HIRAN domain-containing protein [Chthoniobacterales bacterium]